MRSGQPATAIIEVKTLGADLNGSGRARLDRPKEQIVRYTTGCSFSGVNTLGMLTDGNVWHLVRQVEGRNRPLTVGEFHLLDGPVHAAAAGLDEIRRLVDEAAGAPSRPAVEAGSARELTEAVAEGRSPRELLGLLAAPRECRTDLGAWVSLGGKLQYAESKHWDAYAFGLAGRLEVSQGDLDDNPACAAVVQMSRPGPAGAALHRADVASAAAAFAKSVSAGVSVVLAIQPDGLGAPVAARLAVCHEGHTGMTVEFDPHAPPPLVLRAIQRVQEQLRNPGPAPAAGLADAVSPAGAQRAFYEAVTGWVLRQYGQAPGVSAQKRRHKEAVLRHLIRTMFAWMLKEEGKLPQQTFDQTFAKRNSPGNYHQDMLAFLFHERLNKPPASRSRHPVPAIDEAMAGVEFLNGSLFAVHDGDSELSLADEEYFDPGDDGRPPGLFTLLSDYDWTATEHLPAHSDQAIAPEVLGSLFENLIAVTEADETPHKMPQGTYYTPPDVAQEMTRDALMLAVRDHAPATWTEQHLLDLFGDPDIPIPPCASEQERDLLVARIEKLAVFDPCVGSGVFLVSALHAIRDALAKLGRGGPAGETTRRIISRQLHAQDINPMAAQITRLRLFVALIAAEPDGPTGPLPNLEAKVVCADTLRTAARRDWSPSATGALQDHQGGIVAAVRARGEIFARWQDAHDEDAKQKLRAEDERARQRLQDAIKDLGATPETEAFAAHRLLDVDAGPALTDARLLFHKPDRDGFDVVIGNPPYERLGASNSKDRIQITDRLARLQYKTLNCADLYTLITEAGLALTKRDQGVLTLIVPLSLCFGQKQAKLRELLETTCGEIRVRSQDNRPDTTFKESPVAHPENRQRTTILSAVSSINTGKPDILVTGANKWPKSQRHSYLKRRQYIPKPEPKPKLIPQLDCQWERISTETIQKLILAMRSADIKILHLRQNARDFEEIGFPKTAYEYITTTPAGLLQRGESTAVVGDKDDLLMAVAAANSHPAYAWWKAYGDAFHVKPHEIETIAIPDTWINHPTTRQCILSLAAQLIATITPDNTKIQTSGTKSTRHQNIDFHQCAPETIAEIDELYLTGLNLTPQPLLNQLRTLRTNTTWQIN